MLRRQLPVAAVLAFLGAAAQQSSAALQPRNGRIVFTHLGARAGRDQIYTTTATGTRRRQLTSNRRFSSFAPSYSPNGKRIVFVRALRQSDLWQMQANGTRPRRLTWTQRISEATPSWSPDGAQIVFAVVLPAALRGIWVVDSDRSNRHRLTSGLDAEPAWSPNGSEIAFQRYDQTSQTFAIFAVAPSGGTPTQLTNDPSHSDLEPAWSPDGSRVLFASDRGPSNQLDLWVLNLMAASPQPSLERVTNTPNRDEHDPAWSPNGRRIVYVGEGAFHGASSYQLYVSDADGSSRHMITHACGECAILNNDPSWQPLRR